MKPIVKSAIIFSIIFIALAVTPLRRSSATNYQQAESQDIFLTIRGEKGLPELDFNDFPEVKVSFTIKDQLGQIFYPILDNLQIFEDGLPVEISEVRQIVYPRTYIFYIAGDPRYDFMDTAMVFKFIQSVQSNFANDIWVCSSSLSSACMSMDGSNHDEYKELSKIYEELTTSYDQPDSAGNLEEVLALGNKAQTEVVFVYIKPTPFNSVSAIANLITVPFPVYFVNLYELEDSPEVQKLLEGLSSMPGFYYFSRGDKTRSLSELRIVLERQISGSQAVYRSRLFRDKDTHQIQIIYEGNLVGAQDMKEFRFPPNLGIRSNLRSFVVDATGLIIVLILFLLFAGLFIIDVED